MATPYNHLENDPKWQRIWQEKGVFRVPLPESGIQDEASKAQKRRYILDMFPYPSGAGLHVGHPEGYTATDVVARYWRMKGEHVLHTMGWDAFGLPAENYAIKTGVHPAESTKQNIDNFRRQIQSIGFSYDWQREFSTSDPSYYRWTQWMFLFLYDHGLAERKASKVNWCESCKTVLANEQVVGDSECERCGNTVIQKVLKQWFFKISEYADTLIDGLDALDWPEGLKQMQRNWIGKTNGLVIHHPVEETQMVIDTFTTTAPWSFADTFIAIAPEHPLVPELVKDMPQEHDAHAFVEKMQALKDEERTDDDKTKEGVFTGRYATDPFDGKRLPIWIANYVLPQYGTGAVRASAHDARDAAFANTYGIQLKEVVDRVDGMPANAHEHGGVLKDSGIWTGREVTKIGEEFTTWAVEKGIAQVKTTYKLRDWLVSRQRYWGAPIPIVYDDQGDHYPVPASLLPVMLPKDVDFRPTGDSPLVGSKEFHDPQLLQEVEDALKAQGTLPHDRTIVRRESDTLDGFVCSSWYMFRYIDPHNAQEFASSEALQRWMPVDLYVGGAEHAVLHLLYARFLTQALYDACLSPVQEPFKALRNQGIILAEDGRKMSKRWGNVVNPDDVIHQYGADTLRMYELFMGPIEDAKPWSENGVRGVRRFVDKTWGLFAHNAVVDADTPSETRTLLYKTLKQIGNDIEGFKFNTSISSMMILVNHLLEDPTQRLTHEVAGVFVRVLSPFAPHLAEELFASIQPERSQQGELVCQLEWPAVDEDALQDETITIGVQINGKTRGSIQIEPDATQDEVLRVASELPAWSTYVSSSPKKVIYVPGKILNVIV